MKEKLINILIVAFLAVLIAACNIPIRTANESTSTNAPPVQLTVTESAEEAKNREVPAPANTDGAETILIPGATFWMGSEETDTLAFEDEMPWHQVTVSGFFIYTHEVTNEMYARCVEAGDCLPIHEYESGPTTHASTPDFAAHPVVGADWLMAQHYCTWAGGRLPTEAEWELAARGSDSLVYPWGDEEATCDRVNMLSCIVPSDTVKVGSYLNGNSPYEVWDMSGNVWEWVNDWYDEDYYALSSPINPIGPYYSETKVARGGGLYSDPLKMRSAERAGVDPHRAYDDVGFRCVPTGLSLPVDYIQPDERHVWSLPDPLEGGGERLEDTEGVPPEREDEIPWVASGRSSASCPDAGGRMHLFLEIDTSEEDVVYEVLVEGIPFSCTYNETLSALECEGPLPEDNEELTDYHVQVHVSGFGIAHFYPDRPLDCPVEMVPIETVELSQSCAEEDGFVNLNFHYTPPITWTSIVDFVTSEEVHCVMDSPNSSTCTLPMNDTGIYLLSWRGNYTDGSEVIYMTYHEVPEDCGGESSAQTIDPFCFEGHPMVQVMYLPETRLLGEVTNDGRPLDCIGMAPGVQICGNLVGDLGLPTQIDYCFEGEDDCFDGSILMPDCQETQTVSTLSITPQCYPSLGPVAVIDYFPADLPLVAANANGFDLTCYDSPEPGYYMCSGIPGSPGSTMTITFCLSDGTCLNSDILVPNCDEPTDPVGFWNLVDVNCFHVTDIYMIIDTSMSELVPGVEFNYSVQTADGTSSYTCEMHPSIAGRIFCWGAPPMHNSPLEVCVSTPGVEERCNSFDDFWVNVPLCAVPVTEEPTEEPGEPDEPPLDCSIYEIKICGTIAGCHWDWDVNPPEGLCVNIP